MLSLCESGFVFDGCYFVKFATLPLIRVFLTEGCLFVSGL